MKIIFTRIQLYNNWHNLLKEYHHISPTNFAVSFSSEIKREKAVFKKCNFFGHDLFSSPRKPGLCISRLYFSFLSYYEVSLYKVCLHNLCMSRGSLDRESLDCVSWVNTTHSFIDFQVLNYFFVKLFTRIDIKILAYYSIWSKISNLVKETPLNRTDVAVEGAVIFLNVTYFLLQSSFIYLEKLWSRGHRGKHQPV